MPPAGALAARLSGVQAVIYLVFNEGYAASSGAKLVRVDLCAEAIRLGRVLHRLLPDDAESAGLLALMLLAHAHAPARVDAAGRPVLLADQDRALWSRELIAEGTAVLDAAVARRSPGPYQLQAAIAAVHAQAPSFDQTDWPQIAALYSELARRSPSPVIEVNRAVAVGLADGPLAGLAVLAPVLASGELARRSPSPVIEVNRAVAMGLADGPMAGLAVLAPVLASGELDNYAPLHTAHADLLDRAGRTDEATAAWARAIETTDNRPLREALERRVAGRDRPERLDP